MAKIDGRPAISMTLGVVLDEQEARALNCISSYNADDLLKGIKSVIGESQLTDHEAGLRRFFESMRTNTSVHLRRLDDAKRVFIGIKVAVDKPERNESSRAAVTEAEK